GVEQQDVRTNVQILHRPAHGELAGAEDVDGVDGLRLDHTNSYGAGAAEDLAAHGDAMLGIDDLGVVDADHGWLAVENDRGGDHRAGQTAAAYFVGAGDGPKTKIAEPALHRGHLGEARQLREEASVQTLVRGRLLSPGASLRFARLCRGDPGGSRALRVGPGHGVQPRSYRSSESRGGTSAPHPRHRKPCAR